MSDLISREKAIEAVIAQRHKAELSEHNFALRLAEDAIRQLPSTDRPTGRWVPVTNGRGGHECDQCHNYAPSWATGEERLTNFCPNCGAKMEVEE